MKHSAPLVYVKDWFHDPLQIQESVGNKGVSAAKTYLGPLEVLLISQPLQKASQMQMEATSDVLMYREAIFNLPNTTRSHNCEPEVASSHF